MRTRTPDRFLFKGPHKGLLMPGDSNSVMIFSTEEPTGDESIQLAYEIVKMLPNVTLEFSQWQGSRLFFRHLSVSRDIFSSRWTLLISKDCELIEIPVSEISFHTGKKRWFNEKSTLNFFEPFQSEKWSQCQTSQNNCSKLHRACCTYRREENRIKRSFGKNRTFRGASDPSNHPYLLLDILLCHFARIICVQTS